MSIMTLLLMTGTLYGTYEYGYLQGKYEGHTKTKSTYETYISNLVLGLSNGEPHEESQMLSPTPQDTVTLAKSESGFLRNANWGGPDLWNVVNARRQQFGVNPLDQRDDLCTIASIRLNELLKLGELDGHEGFSNMTERRPDLAPIFQNYSTIAEFLAAGAGSAEETVGLWENSLGHRKLLTGGEYVWGCIYAQNSFAVAISAY